MRALDGESPLPHPERAAEAGRKGAGTERSREAILFPSDGLAS